MEWDMSEQMNFSIDSVGDVESAWQCGLATALAMGFSLADADKIAVVISELGQSIRRYVGQGSIVLTTYAGEDKCVEIVALEQGAGIPDVEQILTGDYSTSNGLEQGISGSQQLMDEFELESVAGKGTTIRAYCSRATGEQPGHGIGKYVDF